MKFCAGDFFLFFFNFIYLFIYLFMAVLGLRFCARAFSSCGKRGPLLIAVRGPLTITASLVAEHRLQTRRLSNCGSRAQLLRGMWDLPRPGLKPVSPTLAGRLSTTAPPGKPTTHFLVLICSIYIHTHFCPSGAFVCPFSSVLFIFSCLFFLNRFLLVFLLFFSPTSIFVMATPETLL